MPSRLLAFPTQAQTRTFGIGNRGTVGHLLDATRPIEGVLVAADGGSDGTRPFRVGSRALGRVAGGPLEGLDQASATAEARALSTALQTWRPGPRQVLRQFFTAFLPIFVDFQLCRLPDPAPY